MIIRRLHKERLTATADPDEHMRELLDKLTPQPTTDHGFCGTVPRRSICSCAGASATRTPFVAPGLASAGRPTQSPLPARCAAPGATAQGAARFAGRVAGGRTQVEGAARVGG